MSASSKKQLRRDEVSASQTQKQQAAAKEAKQTKLYTTIFVVAIVLMLLVVAYATVSNSGIVERKTTAVEIGDQSVSAIELNYYYMDSVNNFFSQYGSFAAAFGLDPSKPLDQQQSLAEEGKTWADYFLELAEQNMQSTYALYGAAMEAGFALPEEDQKTLDATFDSIEQSAKAQGISMNNYLSMLYGSGANEKTFRRNMEVKATAAAYLESYETGLTYTDEQIQAKDSEDPIAYNAFSYNTYVVNAKDYLKGGTADDEGKVTYSDEETAASIAEAEKAAKALVDGKPADLDAFNDAIAKLPVNKDKEGVASIASDDLRIEGAPSVARDWLTDSARKAGDIAMFEKTSTDADDKTVTDGYYVVFFKDTHDNSFALANVRHILVAFEGGKPNADGTAMEYSDEEKAKAKVKAEELLESWKTGAATEDSFAELAVSSSKDPGSAEKGGLYTDVYPGQMVPTFNDWCFDEARQPGDTGIVESEFGYHIMFYSGDSETTYRQFMITSEMRSADVEAWYDALLEATPIAEKNTKHVPTGLILNQTVRG